MSITRKGGTGKSKSATDMPVNETDQHTDKKLISELLNTRVECSVSPLSFGSEMTDFLKNSAGVDKESIVFMRGSLPAMLEESGPIPTKIIRSGTGHAADCPAITGKPLFTLKSDPVSICNECKPGCRVGQPMLRIPVIINKRITSVLTLSFNSKTAISDPSYVNTLERILALELQSFHQEKMIELLEITDNMTGVYNHKYFIKMLKLEMDRSRRYEHEFTLLLADVDHFRDFNAAHGHDVGDLMLNEVAAQLRTCIRATDLIARFSGQQFAIILTETGPSGVDIVKKKLKKAAAKIELNVPDYDSPLTTSVSVGQAVFPVDATMPSKLILCADTSLRTEKNMRKPVAKR